VSQDTPATITSEFSVLATDLVHCQSNQWNSEVKQSDWARE